MLMKPSYFDRFIGLKNTIADEKNIIYMFFIDRFLVVM